MFITNYYMLESFFDPRHNTAETFTATRADIVVWVAQSLLIPLPILVSLWDEYSAVWMLFVWITASLTVTRCRWGTVWRVALCNLPVVVGLLITAVPLKQEVVMMFLDNLLLIFVVFVNPVMKLITKTWFSKQRRKVPSRVKKLSNSDQPTRSKESLP